MTKLFSSNNNSLEVYTRGELVEGEWNFPLYVADFWFSLPIPTIVSHIFIDGVLAKPVGNKDGIKIDSLEYSVHYIEIYGIKGNSFVKFGFQGSGIWLKGMAYIPNTEMSGVLYG